MNSREFWSQFLDRLKAMDGQLPKTWAPELPPETAPDFWKRAALLEFQTRDALSAKIRQLVIGPGFPAMTPLEAWLYRRRVEWAGQIAVLKAEAGVVPPVPMNEVLLWALVKSWETDGCIALWNHYERGGKAAPGAMTSLFE